METKEKLKSLLSKLKSDDEWGTYFIGRYYFSIATKKKRAEYGLTQPKQELSKETQLKLQWEHFPALFHEYIHYLHELSTVIGNATLSLDLSAKAIFSNWLTPDPKSSVSDGLKPECQEKYIKAVVTQDVLFGDFHNAIKGKFLEVKKINYIKQDVFFPYGTDFKQGELSIPSINFDQFADKTVKTGNLLLGKYFLYEGLAYELDRIVDKQVRNLEKIEDYSKGTEYTVLRRLAQFIYPQIDKYIYLSIGAISLQYMECGSTFIKMIERVKQNAENGISQKDTLEKIKSEASSLLKSKRTHFQEAQDEYVKVFENRKNLHQSFSFLTDQMKTLYDKRIENPSFEIDHVFDNRFRDILDFVQICDYMYLFTDEDEFVRDFLGTSIDKETSLALKTVICYDHYYKMHKIFPTTKVEKSSAKCPFYTCCDLSLRKDHEETCKTKPWRIYEIAAKKDNQQCWYGGAVLEFKGHNEYTCE